VAANKEREEALRGANKDEEEDEEETTNIAAASSFIGKDGVISSDGHTTGLSMKKKKKKKNQQTSIYEDGDTIYSLKDLINCDFDMPITDKDFQLSHEQLVRASKILLHKINYQGKKNKYENEQAVLSLQK
jgi:hypothetical protein